MAEEMVGARTPGVTITTLDELKRFALAAAASGFIGRGEHRDVAVAKAMMIVQYGAELGLGPMTAINGISIIDGVPAMKAGLVSSLIKSSGTYDYRILELTEERCTLRFFERRAGQWEALTPDVTFTIEDAKRAGVPFETKKGNPSQWTKYPRNMLFARALTNGARWHCPSIFRGAVYVPEEVSSGDIIDVEPIPADAMAATGETAEDPTEPHGEMGRHGETGGGNESVTATMQQRADGASTSTTQSQTSSGCASETGDPTDAEKAGADAPLDEDSLLAIALTNAPDCHATQAARDGYLERCRKSGKFGERSLRIVKTLLKAETNIAQKREDSAGFTDEEKALLAEAYRIIEAAEERGEGGKAA